MDSNKISYILSRNPIQFVLLELFSMDENSFPLLTSTNVEFFKMVLPGEKVVVTSKKQYFRFGKLKCLVEMHNAVGELVAKGVFSGIIKNAVK